MMQDQVFLIFAKAGAVITSSHLVYKAGDHGSAYVNKDAIYPYTDLVSALCAGLAEMTLELEPEVVIAPALGGIILSQWTAYHLSRALGRTVYSVYAEKSADGKAFLISRGYDKLLKGKRVLVVEDVLNSGSSARSVVDLVRKHDGNVVGVAGLVDRGKDDEVSVALSDVPFFRTLVRVEMQKWPEADCPLCKSGEPINTTVGHGAEFLARKSASSS